MSIYQAIKIIRTKRKLTQKEVSAAIEKDQAYYSRLEKGKVKINESTLQKLATRLSVTVNELICFSELDNDILTFQMVVKEAIQHPLDLTLKHKILEYYNKLKCIKSKTSKELAMYCAIIISFSANYPELNDSDFDSLSISETFNHLEGQLFYSQFDYLLAFNMSLYYDESQLDFIMNSMFPIEFKNQRSVDTIKYANNLLSNIVTIHLYKMNYQKVINYCNEAQEQLVSSEDYYYRLIINYAKNLALYLWNNSEIHLKKAKEYISIFNDINDSKTALLLENELENLTRNKRYYIDLKIFEITTLKK